MRAGSRAIVSDEFLEVRVITTASVLSVAIARSLTVRPHRAGHLSIASLDAMTSAAPSALAAKALCRCWAGPLDEHRDAAP